MRQFGCDRQETAAITVRVSGHACAVCVLDNPQSTHARRVRKCPNVALHQRDTRGRRAPWETEVTQSFMGSPFISCGHEGFAMFHGLR